MKSRSASRRPTRSTPGHRRAAVGLVALLLAGPVGAHDFWIEPSTYRPEEGQRVALRLRVGQHFLGDAVPRDPALLARFSLRGAGREHAVAGAAGVDPAGFAVVGPGDGALLIAYESHPSVAALDREQLERYLAEEGLDALAAELRNRGVRTVRDTYSRHAKCLLQVPGGPTTGYDRPMGLALELLPGRSPAELEGGGILPIELLFRGAPCAATRLVAIPRRRPLDPVIARTDRRGRAALELGPGEWLLKAVVAEAAPSGDGKLRSYWASLTLHLPETR